MNQEGDGGVSEREDEATGRIVVGLAREACRELPLVSEYRKDTT